MAPFTLEVTGTAEIPHPAERALIHVTASSNGHNKAAVSDEVITTAKHIETLLKDLSPKDETAEAKAAAPLAHWSKTSLSSTSYLPWDYKEKVHVARRYNASVKFDIRFKEFGALGAFGTKISSLEHTEVTHIDWILTAQTQKSFQSQLRKTAAKDAMQKAQDYCEVLGCTNVRPVKLNETQGAHRVNSLFSGGMNSRVSYQQAQTAPGHNPGFGNAGSAGLFGGQMAPSGGAGAAGAADQRDESALDFRPQEVRMSMSVSVKFHADNGAPVGEVPVKRARTEDSEMSE